MRGPVRTSPGLATLRLCADSLQQAITASATSTPMREVTTTPGSASTSRSRKYHPETTLWQDRKIALRLRERYLLSSRGIRPQYQRLKATAGLNSSNYMSLRPSLMRTASVYSNCAWPSSVSKRSAEMEERPDVKLATSTVASSRTSGAIDPNSSTRPAKMWWQQPCSCG